MAIDHKSALERMQQAIQRASKLVADIESLESFQNLMDFQAIEYGLRSNVVNAGREVVLREMRGELDSILESEESQDAI